MSTAADNTFMKFVDAFHAGLQNSTGWVRESMVEPNRKEYFWYHRKFNRVPTIDQCYTDDVVCFQEADAQFKRDKTVDDEVVSILRYRQEECYMVEGPDRVRKCAGLVEDYEQASENWFVKYGDLGAYKHVGMAYMKQKHRLVWERRHGPVGQGMRDPIPEF